MGQEVTAVSGAARNSAAADRDVVDAPVDVARLYRAHERKVMRWAARLGGPGIDVEDVVQDVFLVAKRRLRSWDGSWNVETWLFRTTEKIVMAARRKRRLRRWLSLSREPSAPGMSAPRPTPAEALERDRAIDEVYRVLDRLLGTPPARAGAVRDRRDVDAGDRRSGRRAGRHGAGLVVSRAGALPGRASTSIRAEPAMMRRRPRRCPTKCRSPRAGPIRRPRAVPPSRRLASRSGACARRPSRATRRWRAWGGG